MSPFLSLLLLLLSSLVLTSSHDPSFLKAMSLLSEYSSSSTNLTLVLSLLEQSAASHNPEAYSKLGEFHLFGYPISPDNPILASTPLPPFIDPDTFAFQRNFTTAVRYLQQGDSYGAKESSAMLALVMKLGLVIEEFQGLVGPGEDFENEYDMLHLSAIAVDSELMKAEVVAGHIQCEKVQEVYLPEFLASESPAFYKIPYFDEWNGCFGSCNNIVFYALSLASTAVKHYQEKGGVMNYDIGPLQDVADEVERKEAVSRIALLKGEAAVGDRHAAAHLADNYLFGNTEVGIDRNPEEAMRYYEQAAVDGNVFAMQNLGILYLQGIGREKNYTLALKYLQEAADAGSISAYNGLGFIYQHGFGVEANSTKAFEYFKIAADAGYLESQSNLGVFYLNGEGVEQNFTLALRYFSQAASSGHLPAMFNLGIMHLNGYGTKRNCKMALSLFAEAYKSGALGQLLQQGYYFYKYNDFQGAFLRYAQAAALGFPSGMLSAAYMWEKSQVPFVCKHGNNYCAAQYYAQAALQEGDEWAYYRLGDIAYYGGDYFNSSMKDAFQMYREARDVPEALFAIAYMHEHGEGVPVDFEAARQALYGLIAAADDKEIDSAARYPAYISLVALNFKEIVGPLWAWFTSPYNEPANWY